MRIKLQKVNVDFPPLNFVKADLYAPSINVGVMKK